MEGCLVIPIGIKPHGAKAGLKLRTREQKALHLIGAVGAAFQGLIEQFQRLACADRQGTGAVAKAALKTHDVAVDLRRAVTGRERTDQQHFGTGRSAVADHRR